MTTQTVCTTREQTIALLESGAEVPHYSKNELDPVLFFGGPFSNFEGGALRISWDGHLWSSEPYTAFYNSVECFFQACKGQTKDVHDFIQNTYGPGDAKQRGNSRTAFVIRPDWDDGVSVEAMLAGLRAKFYRGSQHAEVLLDTGYRYIAEDSPTDYIWGIRDQDYSWTGKNLLGEALMRVRDELRSA